MIYLTSVKPLVTTSRKWSLIRVVVVMSLTSLPTLWTYSSESLHTHTPAVLVQTSLFSGHLNISTAPETRLKHVQINMALRNVLIVS